MLGFLKKVVHRGEDYDDIRSHVLGERMGYDSAPEPSRIQLEPQPYQPGYPPVQQPPPLPEPPELEPRFESRYGESSAPQLSGFGEPAQLSSTAERTSRDYDILDRLNLIESQVAAIRSMSETINERLKNIEAKLGTRRY